MSYSFMSHSYKERPYHTSYIWRGDHYSGAGDGIYGVGPRTTQVYSQNCNFIRDRHDGDFQKYQCQHTAPPMALFMIRYYPDGAYYASFF